MAVGKDSILRAANAGKKAGTDALNQVGFLTGVSEEVLQEAEGRQSQVKQEKKKQIRLKEQMPAHLL